MDGNSTADTKAVKKKRQRSPNYPAIGLERALELAKKQYETDGTQKIPARIAHDRWGYKPGGSPAETMLAALRAYGLIDVESSGEKCQVTLTELARKIFLDHPDRTKIIQGAALAPKVHREIWDHYSGDIPRDDVLRHYLIWDVKFNDKAIEGFISQFRDTISFANLTKDTILDEEKDQTGSDDNGGKDEGNDPPKLHESNVEKQKKMQQLSKQGDFRELRFWLPSGNAVLFVPEGMGAPDFDVLRTYIGAMKTASAAGYQTDEDSEDND